MRSVALAVGAGAAAMAAAVAARGGRTRLPRLPLRTLCNANATKDVINPPPPKKVGVGRWGRCRRRCCRCL